MDPSIQNSKKDHRQWGRDLELFSFHEEGPGFPFFHSRGIALKNALIDAWRRRHHASDYHEIQSPLLLDQKLWQKSGHWDLYKENMYFSEVEKRQFAIKPMNCPGAILYFQEKRRSHRELPFRVSELGQVHRDELSGALSGLLRVRSFMVDDGHIFCKPEQVLPEVKDILKMAISLLKLCGFEDFVVELSLRGSSSGQRQKYLGDDSDWKKAQAALVQALEESDLKFKSKPGEAKFYGPAIDIKIKDNSGRLWQCSSIQMDFNLAHRFGLHYFDDQGRKQVPLILHRCIYGSLERLIAILLEHHQGRLPFWLSPVQVQVISALPKERIIFNSLFAKLDALQVRYEKDERDLNLRKKIKDAQQKQVPLMLIIGARDISREEVSLRWLDGRQQNGLSLSDLSQIILHEQP